MSQNVLKEFIEPDVYNHLVRNVDGDAPKSLLTNKGKLYSVNFGNWEILKSNVFLSLKISTNFSPSIDIFMREED